jgi:amino acid efflux transporter
MNTESQQGEPDSALSRHLTLRPAVALAITTVIGGGALALPAAALARAGDDAVLGWALAAVITVPLIVVFATLGARYPTAGGIAGFVQRSFGRKGAAGVEVVLIGTEILAIPAIALTGGGYLAAALGWPTTRTWIGAALLLVLASSLLAGGSVLSSRVQTILAIILTVALAGVGILGLSYHAAHLRPPSLSIRGWKDACAAVGIVFFGFTGWEVVASTLGEYRDPKRDFPRVVTLSFLIAIGIYILLALGVQAVLSRNASRDSTAPLYDLITIAVSPTAATLVSTLGVVVLTANLISALWGASRLVFSSAREGLLPAALSGVSKTGAVPRRAVITTGLFFLFVVGLSAVDVLTPTTMFEIAGQNFFLLYILTAVVFAREAITMPGRVAGVVIATALLIVIIVVFDLRIIAYPVVLFTAGVLIDHIRKHASRPMTARARPRHPGVDGRGGTEASAAPLD